MNTKEKLNNTIEQLDIKFDTLMQNEELNINSIEKLAIDSTNNAKTIINTHIEQLILKKINEKELITKKN